MTRQALLLDVLSGWLQWRILHAPRPVPTQCQAAPNGDASSLMRSTPAGNGFPPSDSTQGVHNASGDTANGHHPNGTAHGTWRGKALHRPARLLGERRMLACCCTAYRSAARFRAGDCQLRIGPCADYYGSTASAVHAWRLTAAACAVYSPGSYAAAAICLWWTLRPGHVKVEWALGAVNHHLVNSRRCASHQPLHHRVQGECSWTGRHCGR